MREVQVNKELPLAAPANATKIEIFHEWQNELLVSDDVLTDTYTYSPNSIGVLKVVWYDNIQRIGTDFYSVVLPLISPEEFFETREELESLEESFPELERVARFMIEGYTGQRFGPYVDKTIVVQGDGGDSLVLPLRLMALKNVSDNWGTDMTTFLQISPSHDAILQGRPEYRRGGLSYDIKRDISFSEYTRFADTRDFTITGNWGWDYVPVEVSQAAALLIEDALANPDAFALRKHGVFEAQLGDFSLKLNADQWGTTGNIQADQLLSKYVNYGIELV